jgi:acetylornithine deacetylase/succinyl-diaminopimelate desuccinylase-like protein
VSSEAVEVLQQLLRFNTVNPPGNERPAQEYLAGGCNRPGWR